VACLQTDEGMASEWLPAPSLTVCRVAGYGIGVAMSMNVIPGSPAG
jgi:hypothetical protein